MMTITFILIAAIATLLIMRFASYSGLDSQHVSDGDVFFNKMVTRYRPEQLNPGEVALSFNGRMEDGRIWKPRKGTALAMETPSDWIDVDNTLASRDIINFVDSDGIEWLFTTNGDGLAGVNTLDGDVPSERVFMYMPAATLNSYAGCLLSTDRAMYWFNKADSVPMKFTGSVNPHRITTATRASNVVTVTTSDDHGLTAGEFVSVFDTSGFTTSIDGRWEVASVPTSTTFTFAQTAADQGPVAQGTSAGVCYTMSFVSTTATTATSDDDVSMSVSGGTCTISATAHGRATGDVLTVYDGGGSGLAEGDTYVITVVDANSYTIEAEIPAGTYTVTLGGKQPLGGGYIAMPKCGWGAYHENRLVLPYDPTGNAGLTNELIYSDILDDETFDPIVNQLRFGISPDDYIMNYIPITADRAVVLCRRSVHLVIGITGSLADLQRYEITREYGCVAPLTAVFAAGRIMFLSNGGIATIRIGENYDLFVDPVVLSNDMADFSRLRGNTSTITDSRGTYSGNYSFAVFGNNRYYFFGASANSTGNLYIFNFLNQGWESFDSYPLFFTNAVFSDGFTTSPYVYTADRKGAAYVLEATFASDTNGSKVAIPITAYVTTRAYQFGNFEVKHFTRAQVLGLDSLGEDVFISATTIDPDNTAVIYSTADLTTDKTIRPRIRGAARAIQIKYEAALGGVRGVSIDAWLSKTNDVDR